MESSSLVVYGPGAAGAVAAVAADLGLKVAPLSSPGEAPAGTNLALVSVEADADGGFRLASSLARGGARVVVQGPAKDADLILRALRSGAHEYVVAGDVEALRRALAARDEGPAERTGRLTVVFGAKGGLGATTVSTNLAGAAQRQGARACVVDLDPALGAVCSVLDVTPTFTLTEAVANLHRLDRELLDRSLPHHASGVAVLAPGDDLEAAERVEPRAIATLLALLRRHYDAVVVDGLRGFDERSLAALDAADRVLLLVTQEVAAVRNAQRCLEVFHRLGYPPEKVHVVVNRFQKGASIGLSIVEETLDARVTACAANDFAAVSRAVGKGGLLHDESPRSALTRDLAALAPLAWTPPEPEPRPRSLLARVFAGAPKGGARGAR